MTERERWERMALELRRDAAFSERVSSPVVVLSMTIDRARALASVLDQHITLSQFHLSGEKL